MTIDYPMFSIIMPHYEKAVSVEYMVRALESLRAQEYQNFEILLLHDGPKSRPFSEEIELKRYPNLSYLEVTEKHCGDWGHTLRDIGIRKSKGKYILHMNSDNVLYPFALEAIVKEMGKSRYAKSLKKSGGANMSHLNSNDIIIFPIQMIGVQSDGLRLWYESRNDPGYSTILTGYPPCLGYIDCMQLVMRRKLWLLYGGWYDRSEMADGRMYQRFVQERGCKYVPVVLGEHW